MIRRIPLFAVAVAALLPAGARAQGDVPVLTIVNAGKPAPTVDVFAFTNAGKTRVGTTGSDGAVRVEDAGFREGDRVAVWVRRCEDGRTEVVLVAEGGAEDRDPCAGEAEGEGCGCRRLGAFVWGRGPVTIDVGTGAITTARRSWTSGLAVGAGIDLYQWTKFEDVSGNQPGAMDHEATSWSPGAQVFLEYLCGRWPVAVGLAAGYTRLETRTTYPQGVQVGDIAYYSVGPYVRIGPTRGRFMPYGLLAMDFAWNRGDFVLDGLAGERDHDSKRDGIGGGFQYGIAPSTTIRVEGMYSTTFDDNDADDHIRWKLGLTYRPRGTYLDDDDGGDGEIRF